TRTELQQRRAKDPTATGVECAAPAPPRPGRPPMPTLLSVDQQQPQASLAMPVFKLEHNPGCCSSGKCGGGFQPSSGSHCQVPPTPPPPPTLLASSSGVTIAAGAAAVSASPPGVVDGASPAAVGRPSVLAFLREEEPEPAVPRWTDRRPLSRPAPPSSTGALDGHGRRMNNVEPQDSDRIRSATNAPVTLEAPFAITLSFVQRFVLFVKRLPEYSLIEQKDMIHLIKALLLHRYQRFMVEYHSVSQGDQLALTLLQLIEFYNPARPNLCNMHRVDRIQQGYILLFRRYIQHSFPPSAPGGYFDLMNRLSDLEDLANEFSQLCHIVGFRYEELDPLLIEVFELQQRQRQRMALPPTMMKPTRLECASSTTDIADQPRNRPSRPPTSLNMFTTVYFHSSETSMAAWSRVAPAGRAGRGCTSAPGSFCCSAGIGEVGPGPPVAGVSGVEVRAAAVPGKAAARSRRAVLP
uniref:NR LBD domain-containing protein n=1 Tax=Macrostomum lignano TaxID=282301 RepID=A0A1I8FN27_9PLAT